MLQATIANTQRGKRQKPYEAKQFMPKWGRAPAQAEELDGHAMLDKIKRINRQMSNGRGGASVDAG